MVSSPSWQRATEDLKIDVVSPFEFILCDGSEVRASALVKHFGGANGMLVDIDYDPSLADKIAAAGYGYCANFWRAEFNRSSMIEVLRDWGWTGPAKQKPDWL